MFSSSSSASSPSPSFRPYAPVSVTDESHESFFPTTNNNDSTVGLSSHDHHGTRRTVPVSYHHMEQARYLTWTDEFYDGKPGIIAAFDRDAEMAGRWLFGKLFRSSIFLWTLSVVYWIMGAVDLRVNHNEEESMIDDIFGVYTLILGAFVAVMALRGRQAMLGQHVAVTSEGVRVDNGTMFTVTIAFEHIQKCEVKPYRCCFHTFYEGSYSVTIHREAAPLEQFCCQKTKTLELYGLIHPQEFVDLVMAMKDAQHQGTYEGLDEHGRVELQTMSATSSSKDPTTGVITADV